MHFEYSSCKSETVPTVDSSGLKHARYELVNFAETHSQIPALDQANMNVARGLPVKAKWMNMPGGLLSKIFARVPFPNKFACQSVCVAWCKALSAQSAPGTWGDQLTFLYEEAEEQAIIVLQDCPSMLVTLAHWVESRISSWRYFNFGTEDVKLQLDINVS